MTAQLASEVVAPQQVGNVYVVDDDEAFRHSLSYRLECEGFAVSAFASGREFLERCHWLPQGCVLLDLKMNGMDGLEVVDELRKSDFSMPIIMISAFGDVPDAVRALKAGVCDFFQKPCCTETLLRSVHAALDGQRRRTQGRRASELRDRLFDRLSARETEVLGLLLTGKRNKEIAHDLGLSAKTIEHHRANLMAKLGVDTVAALARLYWEGMAGKDEG
jgi:FixJ family two-component response regulator